MTHARNSSHKQELAQMTNSKTEKGTLKDAFVKADVFIGVSSPGLVSEDMVRSMNKQAIVFALANPTPEIMPDLAKKAGAYIIATGSSDYPNQVNNALAFPGIFRGALDHHVKKVTTEMLMHVAENLSRLVANPYS